jgi:dUTP pyrophosphatase
MDLKIKKLHPDAIVPAYATEGAACFDLHALISPMCTEADRTLSPGEAVHVDTGLAFEVPVGWAMKIYSRSGHGFKHGVRLVNAVGIVDADYRGQVRVGLHNDGDEPITIRHGDRIAQAMLERVERVTFTVVEELGDTARGAGGFGSTGN